MRRRLGSEKWEVRSGRSDEKRKERSLGGKKKGRPGDPTAL
jgi:hypothetical protein